MIFYKVHGLGNDFILIDARELEPTDWSAFAVKYCKRHTGIGADGILLVCNSSVANTKMRIINSDGSEAEMCGNGIRCFAKWVYERGIVDKEDFAVETLSGIVRPTVITSGGVVTDVRVDMGEPMLDCRDIPVVGQGRCIDRSLSVLGKEYRFTSVLVGVPHTYVFVDDLGDVDIPTLGAKIECAQCFPKHTNVNFIHVLDENSIEMRTFERGCGCTLACGTGASGAVVACSLNDRTEKRISVSLQEGKLFIEWAENGHVYMTGPATIVCKGEIL